MNNPTGEQGPAPSPEERVAAAFGNFMGFEEPKPEAPEQSTEAPEAAPEEAAEATNEPTAEEFFEFEAEGKKYQIPKELEKNFLQHKDYTQKTQAIAEQRKTYETLAEQARIANMRAEFEQGIAQELEQLRAFDTVLSQQSQIDWSSMSTDEILKRKLQIDQWKEQRDSIKQQLEGKYREWNAKRDEAVKGLKAKAAEVAATRIPGWNEAVQKAVKEHALTEGYTEVELDQAGLDPRHWVTLWKAQQFDQLKAKAKSTVSDVKSVKTTPANPMPQSVKDKLAFNKQVQKTAPNSSERNKLVEQRAASLFSR